MARQTRYPSEFKVEAVSLVNPSGRSAPTSLDRSE